MNPQNQRQWRYQTSHGLFKIVGPVQGRFIAMFEEEDLGHYASPLQALDDLVMGTTWSVSSGIDTSQCDLPDDLEDWEC